MRVVHIGKFLPPKKGGMESSILHLCREIHGRAGWEVTLMGVQESHQDENRTSVVEKFKVIPFRSLATIASTPLIFGVEKILHQEKPDLVHVHLPNPWVTFLLKNLKIPMVATYHCDILTYPFLKKLYSPLLQTFLGKSKAIITTSPQLLEYNADLQPFHKKVEMVSLTVPPVIKNSIAAPAIPNERTVLFVGRLVPYKGLEYLIEAMEEVRGRLIIVGTGKSSQSLRKLVIDKSLTDKVHFAGEVSNDALPSYYEKARVVALSSITEAEALGICLIESLSAGRPLVTTRLSTGVSYVNVDGETGWTVPPRNSAALAKALNQILDDDTIFQKFSKNATQRYHSHFNSEAIVDKHLKIYQAITEKSR